MKTRLNADRIFVWTRNLPLLLAGIVALSALSPLTSLRAQDIPAINPSALQMPSPVKPSKKPKSDKWTFSLLPVGLQKNPQIEFTFVTEMTDEGRKLPEPSPANPVYYQSHSMGQRDVGDAYGGTKPIPYEALKAALDSSLANNGYRAIDPKNPDPNHPISQVLILTWGMHNKIDTTMDIGDSLGDDMTADDGSGNIGGADAGDGGGDGGSSFSGFSATEADTSARANLLSRAKIVGGQKFANEYAQALMEGSMAMRNFSQRDEKTEALVYSVQNECYYLLVTSLDADALRRNEKKILWTTTVATVSQGVSFIQTLPIMINNASWFFGRETNGAEIVLKNAYKKGKVTIGDAEVVEYITGTSGTNAPKAPAKPAPATSGTSTGKP